MHTLTSTLGAAILAAALPLSAALAQAATWPSAQVTIVVPYPPGSEPDALARDISQALTQKTGKTIVVENRPGANAMVGTAAVARGPADGSMLLLVDRLSLVTNPLLYDKVAYDWKQDLKPVTDLAEVQLYVAVNSKFPAANLREFIDYARANPGKINVGTGGNGHVTHIGMEMLARAEGVTWNYIPYKGIVPAAIDTVGGQVDAFMAGGLVMAPHRASGGIKVLAVGAKTRNDFMADVPTLEQAGGKAGTIPATYFSLFAPATVPDPVIAQIRDHVADALTQDKLRNTYEARGLVIGASQPADMRAAMQHDETRYRDLIKAAGITVQ